MKRLAACPKTAGMLTMNGIYVGGLASGMPTCHNHVLHAWHEAETHSLTDKCCNVQHNPAGTLSHHCGRPPLSPAVVVKRVHAELH